MDKIQHQKRQQFIQVAAVITAHPDAVQALPALASDARLFGEKIAEIDQLAQQQLTGSRGATVAKKAARAAMSDSVMGLFARMTSYSEAIDDPVLLADVKATRSDLLYGRAATSLYKARCIVDKARELQKALEKDYQLTPVVIDAASADVDNFGLLIAAPGKAIDSRAVTTQTLEGAFAEASRILAKRLAGHADTLRESHPRFAQAFDQASILEGRRSADSTPDEAKPEAPAPVAPVASVVAPVSVLAAPPSSNGNGRHPSPEPVAIDLAR